MNGASSCHVLAALARLQIARSIGDLGLSLAVDELISNKEFLIVVAIMLHENEMPEIVKDRSFGASWTDYLILNLHLSEDKKKCTNWVLLLLGFARIGNMDGGRSGDSRVLGLIFCRCCICGNCS